MMYKKPPYSHLTYIILLPGVYPSLLLSKTNQWAFTSQSSEELVKLYAFQENALATSSWNLQLKTEKLGIFKMLAATVFCSLHVIFLVLAAAKSLQVKDLS